MPTDAEMYEHDGTWLVTQGSKQWDKGGAHKILSGLAYTGAVGVAIADGVGNLFSFGLQNDEGAINKAYNAGQISWDERTDLEFAALGRAVAVGIVTVAVTVATAGLGTEAALGLGLARGTFAYGAVVVGGGALSGTLVTASSLGTKSLVTGVGDFSGPNAQAIWKSGMPSATEWKWGLAMGAGFGALGALPKALPGPSGMVVAGTPRPVQTINVDGFDIDLSHDLAVGTHPDGRVAFIRPSGGGIYKPGTGGMLIPLKEVGEGGVPRSMIVPDAAGPVVSDAAALPAKGGSTSMVPYNGSSNAIVPYRPGSTAMLPYGANAAPVLVLDANAAGQVPIVRDGKQMVLGPNSDIMPPPAPMTYPGTTGDEVVSSFLRAKQLTGATTPDADVVNTLMRDYGTTLPAQPEPVAFNAFDPFGLKRSQPQFPQLTAGAQPFGFLPAGKQPIGLLGGPTPEPVYNINPYGSYLPQVAPGTTPKFTSTTLGKNLMQSYGLERSTTFSGWQPHHILVKELAQMPQMKDLAINLDDPTNGIMMPERPTFEAGSGTIMPHQGYHSIYSAAMKEAVGKIDPTLPKSVREIKIFNLQQRARAALQGGAPLYERDGATIEGWRALLNSN
ncbi:MAG: AHH domain-containing protein [Deltaproteobacteria bacterium]